MHIYKRNIHKHDSKPKTELDHARTRNPIHSTPHSILLYIPNTTQHENPLLHTHRVLISAQTQTTYNTTQHNSSLTRTRIPRSFFPLNLLPLLALSSSSSSLHQICEKFERKRERLWDNDKEMQEVNTMEDFLISLPEFRSREGKRDLLCVFCVRDKRGWVYEREREPWV